jgi:ADP-L-glycero-D-manno-heptose 6-epimerase
MIALTGVAGFIGSYFLGFLNELGYEHIILVDDFSQADKSKNYEGKKFIAKIERHDFIQWLNENPYEVKQIFHLGARTDTTEFNAAIFDELNINYSKAIWQYCSQYQVPLVYASSAATYGLGEYGFKDNHEIVEKLQPLNPYGLSKNEFDKWALQQKQQPPFWAGLKFFNVYGPNEYHKGRMASVIFHAYNQITAKGSMNLFRSHNAEYKDGEQLRDFIYVRDVAKVLDFLMQQQPASGLYNLGTGKARTFLDLANAVFNALNLQPEIHFTDTPEDIRDKYQYFTEANMQKLIEAGYTEAFTDLEEGVKEYVTEYLAAGKVY